MSFNLSELSDEELVLLRERLTQGSQSEQEGFEPQPQLGQQQVPQEQFQEEPQEQGAFSRFLSQAKDEFTGSELSPFETGIGEVIRDVAIPAVAQIPETFVGAKKFGEKIAGKGFELFGQDPNALENIETEQGISKPLEKLTTKNAQEVFDDFTDNKFKTAPGEKAFVSGRATEALKGFAKDTATLLNPVVGGKMNTLRGIGTSLAGTLIPEGLFEAGIIDEDQKDTAKLGTWFSMAFVKPGAMKKAAEGLFTRANNAVKGRIITDSSYPEALISLKNELGSVGGDVLKQNKPALELVDSILKDVESGTFKGEFLTKQVKNLNRLISETGGIHSRQAPPLMKVRGIMQDVAERIGEDIPQFIENFNEGNLLWSGLHSKNGISQWISKTMDKSLLQGLGDKAATAVGLARVGGRVLSIPFKPIVKVADFIDRLATNSAARKFYGQLIKSAAENNVKTGAEALRGLDEEFKGSDSEKNSKKRTKK